MKPQSVPSPCPPPKAPHVNMGESRPPSRRYRKAVWAMLPPHFRPCSSLPLPTSQLKPIQTPTAPPPFRSATPPSCLSLKHATRLKPAPRAPIPHPENTANLRQNTTSPPSGTPRFHPTSRNCNYPTMLPALKHATRLKPALRVPILHPETAANLRQNTASPPSGTPRFHPTSRNHNYCNEHEKQKLPVTNTHDFLRRNAFFENFPLTFYDPV